jgi:hypothetical protein
MMDHQDHRDALEDVWRCGERVGDGDAEVERFDDSREIYGQKLIKQSERSGNEELKTNMCA